MHLLDLIRVGEMIGNRRLLKGRKYGSDVLMNRKIGWKFA